MNDHNLDDLIIDTITPKSNKTKSLLTFIALLIIVLIVAIILTKTLLKSPENTELAFEDNMSDMIAPELKLQKPSKENTTEIAKPKEETSLSTIIEDKITAEKEVEKPKNIKPETTEEKITPIAEPIKETVTVTEEVTSVPKVTKAVEVAKPIITAKPETAVKKPVTKPVVKTSSKHVNKPTVSKKAPKPTVSGSYYVQVSSFKSAHPSQRLLSVIKSSGFTSHVTAPDRTGYKKLLIGPYRTRADVDKAKDVIRNRILKSAFVVQK